VLRSARGPFEVRSVLPSSSGGAQARAGIRGNLLAGPGQVPEAPAAAAVSHPPRLRALVLDEPSGRSEARAVQPPETGCRAERNAAGETLERRTANPVELARRAQPLRHTACSRALSVGGFQRILTVDHKPGPAVDPCGAKKADRLSRRRLQGGRLAWRPRLPMPRTGRRSAGRRRSAAGTGAVPGAGTGARCDTRGKGAGRPPRAVLGPGRQVEEEGARESICSTSDAALHWVIARHYIGFLGRAQSNGSGQCGIDLSQHLGRHLFAVINGL
jgi:hypothetical protein